MKQLVVVDRIEDWPSKATPYEVMEAKTYLATSKFEEDKTCRVLNCCRSFRYQSIGYYVSLLAEARGHKPLPSIQTLSDVVSPGFLRIVSKELHDLMQESFKHLKSSTFVLSLYFGKNVAKMYDKLAHAIYSAFPAPLMQATFVKQEEHWILSQISISSPQCIPKEHLPFFKEHATLFFSVKKPLIKKKKTSKYDLAILINPDEPTPPSNAKALQKFCKAAESVGFHTEFLTHEQKQRLKEFDALLLRETTAVNHHTYRIARQAQEHGLVVLDDPESILKCSNKVYLKELLDRYHIKTPKTQILYPDTLDEVMQNLGFPFVLKLPDGTFSKGVTKVDNEKELLHLLPELLDKSDLLLAQEFIPTPFDWRVILLDKTPLAVCKYFMSRRHWQIFEKTSTGRIYSGRTEAFPVSQAPKKIVQAAVKAAGFIGNGFYGVDLKENGGEAFVIEINDNPSIDCGEEDQILKDELYLKIVTSLMQRVENKKKGLHTL